VSVRPHPSLKGCVALLAISSSSSRIVSKLPTDERQRFNRERGLTLRLDRFAWEAIEEEADRAGVPVEDLIAFSTLYYLADLDSGRIARRIPSRYGFELPS